MLILSLFLHICHKAISKIPLNRLHYPYHNAFSLSFAWDKKSQRKRFNAYIGYGVLYFYRVVPPTAIKAERVKGSVIVERVIEPVLNFSVIIISPSLLLSLPLSYNQEQVDYSTQRPKPSNWHGHQIIENKSPSQD
jgi:hypothetical protein